MGRWLRMAYCRSLLLTGSGIWLSLNVNVQRYEKKTESALCSIKYMIMSLIIAENKANIWVVGKKMLTLFDGIPTSVRTILRKNPSKPTAP